MDGRSEPLILKGVLDTRGPHYFTAFSL